MPSELGGLRECLITVWAKRIWGCCGRHQYGVLIYWDFISPKGTKRYSFGNKKVYVAVRSGYIGVRPLLFVSRHVY